jgi:hypothetical protein
MRESLLADRKIGGRPDDTGATAFLALRRFIHSNASERYSEGVTIMATQTIPAISAHPTPATRLAFAGLTLGILSCVLYACILMFARTSNGPAFTTAGDYWLTASGIPFVAALLLITAGIHKLHHGRDGLPGRIGLILTGAAMTAFAVAFTAGLITRHTHALGPLYPFCVAASLAGLVIFTIGMIRARLLPWWTGPALVAGWLIGGPITAFAAAPFVLAAVYATIIILLRKTVRAS